MKEAFNYSNYFVAAASGMIVNTCGWIDGDGYKILLDIVELFSPTVVFVIGNEKLYSSLAEEDKVKNLKEMKLVNLPKSGGVCSLFAFFLFYDLFPILFLFFFEIFNNIMLMVFRL